MKSKDVRYPDLTKHQTAAAGIVSEPETAGARLSHYYWIQSPIGVATASGVEAPGLFLDAMVVAAFAEQVIKDGITPMVVIAWGEVYNVNKPPLLKRTWVFQKRTTIEEQRIEPDDGLGGYLFEQVPVEYIDKAGFPG